MSSESPPPEASPPPAEEPPRLSLLAQRMEALLFATPDPLGVDDLARLLGEEGRPLPPATVQGALEQLSEVLERTGSALDIQQLSGGFRLSTRATHSQALQRLFNEESNRGLSAAALETLAIVAYRQPVTRSEIEKVRGVGCGPILRALLDRGMLRILGQQTSAVGRPHLYGTTAHFLEAFGLRDLNDLPELEPRHDLLSDTPAAPLTYEPVLHSEPGPTPHLAGAERGPGPIPGEEEEPEGASEAPGRRAEVWTWGRTEEPGGGDHPDVDSPTPRDTIPPLSVEPTDPAEPLQATGPMHDTPLLEQHKQLGARIVEFAGWNMPVVYTSIVEEHTAVRERVGLFDLSHMGRLVLSGPSIRQALDRLVPADLDALEPGQAKYSFFLTDGGGFIDDILIYARPDDYYVVVNASNREAVLAWLAERLDGQVTDLTFEQAMLAVQGPRAVGLVDRLAEGSSPAELAYYRFAEATLFGTPITVARTGYTGEDGFELYLPAAEAARFWQGLLEAGAEEGILPCGLGARDTLRLEAAMALYGHEIDREGNPVEARLSWAVAWDKPDFVGKQAIEKIKQDGPARRLVGLRLDCKRVPREGQEIYLGEERVGVVTSGTVSPTLDQRIAMGYVRTDLARLGTALSVDIRGNREPAEVIKLPFYKREK